MSNSIHYVTGDATTPDTTNPAVIVHVVNTAGGWGRGFVVALSRRWPQPERAYREWMRSGRAQLGMVQPVRVEEGLWVLNLLAQVDYKSAANPVPLDYAALETCLSKTAEFAAARGAGVHMPRIGAGLAGGDWARIETLIQSTLCAAGIPVTVYDLP